MSTEWIKKKRENWPEGSKERALGLKFPGCKSAVDAFKKTLEERTKTKAPLGSPSVYEEMKLIIAEIETLIRGRDIDRMNKEKREILAKLPLLTIEDARAWRDQWRDALG